MMNLALALLLLADEPASFADAVVRVLTDKSYAFELGQRAASIVRKNHGWREVTESFVSICVNSSQADKVNAVKNNTESQPSIKQKSVETVDYP